jgi:flagellar motor switch protein FliN/FliY
MTEQAPKQQVHATPYAYKPLGGLEKTVADLGIDDNNLELIMSVPIQITVELGKTRKKIKDIAELTVGNIVELNRQAGDHVDVMANGRLIARGDVVVVDDNYSVRITEIIRQRTRGLVKASNFNRIFNITSEVEENV